MEIPKNTINYHCALDRQKFSIIVNIDAHSKKYYLKNMYISPYIY